MLNLFAMLTRTLSSSTHFCLHTIHLYGTKLYTPSTTVAAITAMHVTFNMHNGTLNKCCSRPLQPHSNPIPHLALSRVLLGNFRGCPIKHDTLQFFVYITLYTLLYRIAIFPISVSAYSPLSLPTSLTVLTSLKPACFLSNCRNASHLRCAPPKCHHEHHYYRFFRPRRPLQL